MPGPFAVEIVPSALMRFRPVAGRSVRDGWASDSRDAAAGTLGLGDELDMLATDLPTADDLLGHR